MKKLLCVSACCLLAAGFTACSDDELAGSGGYGIPATQTPVVTDAGIKFPVTSYCNFDYAGHEETFSYENGRMTGVQREDGKHRITFSFNPLLITEVNDYDIDGSIATYKNIKVNSSGFITYCEYNEVMFEDNDYYTYNSVISCGYDKDGHLLYIKESGTDSDGDSENETIIYTWEEGNMVEVEDTWTASWSETEISVDIETYTYDIEKYPNPGIYYEADLNDCMGWFPAEFCYSGLLGRPTKNIPIEMLENNSRSYKNGNSYKSSDSYSIVPYYNEDGSVNRITSSVIYGNNTFPIYNTYYYGYADNPVRSLKKSMPEQQRKENRRQARRLKHKKNV